MMRADSGRRLLLLAVVFALLGSALIARLGYWQVSQRDRLVQSANSQLYVQTEIPGQRGNIYDRTGTVLLASTVTRERLIASAQELSSDQQAQLVQILTPLLSLGDADAAAMTAELATGKPYLVLARDLTPSTAESIRSAVDQAGLPGVTFETTHTRAYQPGGAPGISLAAQLLGFVNGTGAGQYGVEEQYQATLAGTPRVVEADKDANGQPIAATAVTVSPGSAGQDIQLTIDAGLQLELEQEALAAQIADRADSVSIVVMDPYSGAVYGDASYPSYDANDYGVTADQNPSAFLDPSLAQVYEPGSVMKLLTTIAALETGTATLHTVYRDTGTLVLDHGRNIIQDADRRAMGKLQLQDAVAYSRNVVLTKVAFGLAPTIDGASQILHSVWSRFGFGQPTGIDVAGEVGGLVNDPAVTPWRAIDLANAAFGQGIAVTPLQLATAYSAMVNGGILVQPHVVETVGGQPVAVQSRGQIMDSALTPMLEGLMVHVLSTNWYHDDVKGTPYWLGGKTGTAQIWDSKAGRWLTNQLNFSFIGFVGRKPGHPDLVIAVKIGGARPAIGLDGSPILAVKSTELFRRVATDAMSTPDLLPPLPVADVPSPSPGG